MKEESRTLLARTAAFALMALVSLVSVAGIAYADGNQQKLGIFPLDYDGAYFDLTLQPGERQELKVEVGNYGTEPVLVRTYPADAYTVVNGGFGARLDGQRATGATLWLSYLPQTIELPAGGAIQRTFDVSVPSETPPGEYATSLVVQNAVPTSDEGTGFVLQQVRRSVIAVVITIPGPRLPGLSIDSVDHTVVAETSIVSFVVTNRGNVRVRPTGEFVLRDNDGVEVTRFKITMGTFYARTSTTVEVPFDALLLSGSYTARLRLTHGDRVEDSGPLALTVPKAKTPPIVERDASGGSKRATANQSAEEEAPWNMQFSWPLLAGSGALVFVVSAAAVLLALSRRRSREALRETR